MKSIAPLLNQSVTRWRLASQVLDDYGNPVQPYSLSTVIDARVEARSGRMEFGDGWVEFRGWRLWMDEIPDVDFTDQIELPNGVRCFVRWIDPQPDRAGDINHTIVWVEEIV